jgi:hypothetical protein
MRPGNFVVNSAFLGVSPWRASLNKRGFSAGAAFNQTLPSLRPLLDALVIDSKHAHEIRHDLAQRGTVYPFHRFREFLQILIQRC